jgi:uncharacterized protein YeaO (DUF488 family)
VAIHVVRLYREEARRAPRPRFLVDRVWPRGVGREELGIEAWLRDVAPSDELRRWFGHEPSRWEGFLRRYFAELDRKPDAWRPLLEAARRGEVTLLFGARDEERNNAVALREYLERNLAERSG